MTITPLPIPGPLGLGDLLDRAFRLYRAHFWSLLAIAAVVVVPVALVTGFFSSMATGCLVAFGDPTSFAPADETDFFAGALAYLVILLVSTLLYSLAQGFASLALTAHNIASLQQRSISIGEGLRIAARRFWTYVRMSIVQWLAQLGVAMAVILPIMCVFVAWFASIGMAESSSELAVLGLVTLTLVMYGVAIALYLVPMVYLSARWIVTVPGIVDQSWGAVESLRRSWRLTKNNVWRCVGYLVLLGLLNLVITNLPNVVISQIIIIVLPENLALGTMLSTAVGAVFLILWQPLSVAAVVLLYYDLRVRQESYDLSLRIAQMEAETARSLATADVFAAPPPASPVS